MVATISNVIKHQKKKVTRVRTARVESSECLEDTAVKVGFPNSDADATFLAKTSTVAVWTGATNEDVRTRDGGFHRRFSQCVG